MSVIQVIIGVMLALVFTRQMLSIIEMTELTERGCNVELFERQRVQELLNQYNDELEGE